MDPDSDIFRGARRSDDRLTSGEFDQFESDEDNMTLVDTRSGEPFGDLFRQDRFSAPAYPDEDLDHIRSVERSDAGKVQIAPYVPHVVIVGDRWSIVFFISKKSLKNRVVFDRLIRD